MALAMLKTLFIMEGQAPRVVCEYYLGCKPSFYPRNIVICRAAISII